MTEDDCIVEDLGGKFITRLNHRLAIRQGVSDDQLVALKASHMLRHYLFEIARQHKKEPVALRLLARMFDHLENEQQVAWNFGADPNYHHFFDLPGCECPVMDNQDRLGTPYKVYSGDCPIHGQDL